VTRPPFEVADIVRQHGDRFLESHRAWVTGQHRRVLRAIAQCRTAALGGHRDRCDQCAQPALSYNSCRDRHCPKCLTAARNVWVTAREQELLPVGYVHLVFTVPEPLARWIHARPTFFLPVKVLHQVFRGKLVAGLREAFAQGRLHFPGTLASLATEAAFRAWIRSLHHQPWMVYAKPPFGSPAHVLHYLARYTHRVAISNHRLVAVTDDSVSFRWKDYRHGSQIRTLRLDVHEFIRRFLLHVLPKRFVRIRYFGLLAPRCRIHDLATCRAALAVVPAPPATEPSVPAQPRSTWPCPRCGAPMRIVERLTVRQLFLETLLADIVYDSS
jgi:hypothetical protein